MTQHGMTGKESESQAHSQEQLALRRAIEHAIGLIQSRFETGSPENLLTFHNTTHTLGVMRRATSIAEALGLSEKETMLALTGSAFHDTVQEWEPRVTPEGFTVRYRKEGFIEEASAQEAEAWMKQYADLQFEESDFALVRQAILATRAHWDPEYNAVVQPDVLHDIHPVALTVALADLGTAGMEPDVFKNQGDLFFIESEIEIVQALRDIQNGKELPEEIQQKYVQRYQEFQAGQISFAQGRKKVFEQEIRTLNPEIQARLRALFSKFDASIQDGKENSALVQNYTFAEMMARLLPQLP